MGEYAAHDGPLDATGMRFAIVVARFNRDVTDRLLAGAERVLTAHGAASVDVARVPGAYEIPVVAKRLAGSGTVDAVICLGTVIRGDTPHFDYVCGEAARGIQQAQLDTGVPVMFGVLTVNTEQQALDRVEGVVMTNKGEEAAEGAVEMAVLLKCLRA